MKRSISVLLVLMMLLMLTACGEKENQVEMQPVSIENTETAGEETLSPREQYEQQKAQMEELKKRLEESEQVDTQNVEPCIFTAGGITLQLDSSFVAEYEAGEELMTYWHKNGDSFSYTMKIGITPTANYAGDQTSQEAAEGFAAQKPEERTVESANGVYYVVQTGQLNVIKAYYVDDSGYVWIVDGTTSTSVSFDEYKEQLVQFCTSGSIN